jgi:hypothetical protein
MEGLTNKQFVILWFSLLLLSFAFTYVVHVFTMDQVDVRLEIIKSVILENEQEVEVSLLNHKQNIEQLDENFGRLVDEKNTEIFKLWSLHQPENSRAKINTWLSEIDSSCVKGTRQITFDSEKFVMSLVVEIDLGNSEHATVFRNVVVRSSGLECRQFAIEIPCDDLCTDKYVGGGGPGRGPDET